MTNEYSSEMGSLLTMLAGFFFLVVFVSIVMYVLQAIALSKIAKKNGLQYWWFAWIPFLNAIVMPMLVEDEVHESLQGKFTTIFIVSFFVSILLSFIFPFLAYVPAVLTYYAFYIIATWYSRKAPVHLIVAVLTFGISLPISLLILSGRERI